MRKIHCGLIQSLENFRDFNIDFRQKEKSSKRQILHRMNRERDSEIVHVLVTSKYKIAERNRLAKIKFLSNMSVDKVNDGKRRDSEPSLAQTERVEVRPVDLSVPGTPVSSHYLASLRKMNRKRNDIETDSEDEEDDGNMNDKQRAVTQELQEGLKQFSSDMNKLQQKETTSHDSKKEEIEEVVKKEAALSRVEQYFRDSARKGSLTRDFTEVVQRFDPKLLLENGKTNNSKPGTPVSSKLIKAEKKSSAKLGSFDMKKLESLKSPEVIKNTDEKIKTPNIAPPEKPKRINAVPLTQTLMTFDRKDFPPVSSALIQPLQKTEEKDFPTVSSQTVSIRSSSNETASNESSSMVFIDKKDIISSKNNSQPVVEAKSVSPISSSIQTNEIKTPLASVEQTTIINQNGEGNQTEKKPIKRVESNISISSIKSDMSVPGTPVDSRRLFTSKINDFSEDDSDIEIIDSSEVKALAQEFVNKIETLVEKTIEEESPAIKEKVDEEEKQSEHKLLIIYDNSSNTKVKEYFDQSEKDKSYQRTFSEIDSFNVPPQEVKDKIEKFFKESEEKKSLTRGFSEAVNYVEPIDIEKLFKPGTPVSSKTVATLKKEIIGDEIIEVEEREIDPVKLKELEVFQKAHDALHINPVDFKVDEYFDQSKERQTLKRDFSEVYSELGTSKIEPKEITNSNVKKFFEESDAQKTFRRQFSEAFQTLSPRIKDILVEQKTEQQKLVRSTSIFSAPPDCTDARDHQTNKKPGKKYAIDKYFATSLYRTAYHRNNANRRGSEPNHRLAILEDEYVFGETDALRSEVFQDDDSTPIRNAEDSDYEQQNVQFWRDFLKPYTLNLPTDIVMRDELIDKYTKYTLE